MLAIFVLPAVFAGTGAPADLLEMTDELREVFQLEYSKLSTFLNVRSS